MIQRGCDLVNSMTESECSREIVDGIPPRASLNKWTKFDQNCTQIEEQLEADLKAVKAAKEAGKNIIQACTVIPVKACCFITCVRILLHTVASHISSTSTCLFATSRGLTRFVDDQTGEKIFCDHDDTLESPVYVFADAEGRELACVCFRCYRLHPFIHVVKAILNSLAEGHHPGFIPKLSTLTILVQEYTLRYCTKAVMDKIRDKECICTETLSWVDILQCQYVRDPLHPWYKMNKWLLHCLKLRRIKSRLKIEYNNTNMCRDIKYRHIMCTKELCM